MLPKPGRGNRVTTTNKTHRMQQPKTHGTDSLPTDPHVACVCQHNACHATQARRLQSITYSVRACACVQVHAHVACRGTSYHAVCVMYMHIAVHIRTHVLRSQQIAISTVNIRAHDRSSVAVDRSGLSGIKHGDKSDEQACRAASTPSCRPISAPVICKHMCRQTLSPSAHHLGKDRPQDH